MASDKEQADQSPPKAKRKVIRKRAPSHRKNPKYCRHSSGRGMVWCGKKAIYFSGVYMSTESLEAYAAYCRSLRGLVQSTQPQHCTTIIDLLALFVEQKYPSLPASEQQQYGVMIKVVEGAFGNDLVTSFRPLKLQRAREIFAEQIIPNRNRRWSRTQVNKQTRRLIKIFGWGVQKELVDIAQYQALDLIDPLKQGELDLADADPIQPVAREVVEETKSACSPTVSSMVGLQALTGMRSGNLCRMRACDIDRTKDVWEYIPEHHKEAWRKQKLFIAFGPKAQAILFQFIHSRKPDEYLFSPRDAAVWKSHKRWEARKSPRWLSAAAKRGRMNPRLQSRYNPRSYRHSIEYAVKAINKEREKLNLKPLEFWHPHQLRHNRGTDVRAEFGAEAAQVSLGHATLDATLIYAERDAELARKVARELG